MITILVLSAAVVVLVAFVLGVVFGVNVAGGRALADRKRSTAAQAVTAQPVTAETVTVANLAVDLAAAVRILAAAQSPIPAHLAHAVITATPEGGHAPALRGAALPTATRPDLEGGNRK